MSIQLNDASVMASRVAEYEQEVQQLIQHLRTLGQTHGLASLSEEIKQTYGTALDDLAALQLQLHLCYQSLRVSENAPDGSGQHGYDNKV